MHGRLSKKREVQSFNSPSKYTTGKVMVMKTNWQMSLRSLRPILHATQECHFGETCIQYTESETIDKICQRSKELSQIMRVQYTLTESLITDRIVCGV